MPDETDSNLLDHDLPSRERLTSADKRIYDRAWADAYPVLWRRGMGFAKMKGVAIAQDREDMAARSIEQFRRALLRGLTSPEELDETFFNEPEGTGD